MFKLYCIRTSKISELYFCFKIIKNVLFEEKCTYFWFLIKTTQNRFLPSRRHLRFSGTFINGQKSRLIVRSIAPLRAQKGIPSLFIVGLADFTFDVKLAYHTIEMIPWSMILKVNKFFNDTSLNATFIQWQLINQN